MRPQLVERVERLETGILAKPIYVVGFNEADADNRLQALAPADRERAVVIYWKDPTPSPVTVT